MVTEADVKKIAHLSRLKISDDEMKTLPDQLTQIMHFAEKISELDLDGISPTSHAVDVKNVFREDVVKPSNVIEEAIKQAPEREGNVFLVPRVLD